MTDKQKEKAEKDPMYLLPGSALRSVARVLGHGAEKHGRYSWKVYDVEAYISALGRHLSKVHDGQLIDEEFGETHFAHMACSCLFLDWMYHNNKQAFQEYKEQIGISNYMSLGKYLDRELAGYEQANELEE